MERIAKIAAGVVALVGLLVLVGWYTSTEWLTTVVPGYVSMKPNTALSLIALGIGVAIPSRQRWAIPLGAFAVGISGATLLEYGLVSNFGLDTILPGIEFEDPDAYRMAPATAVALATLGAAVIGGARGRSRLMRGLAMLAFAVSYVAVLGYLYDVESLYGPGAYTSMAVHTATALAILSVALLLMDRDAGLVGLARDRGSAGQLLRPMVPLLLLGPAALGGFRLWAQEAGWFDTTFGAAILVMSMTLLGGAVTWRAAVRLRAIDRQRAQAEAGLTESNRTLESNVAERTKALQAASERLSTLIRVAPIGIIETDAEGGVLTTNPEWDSLSGLTHKDTMGAGWGAAVHPEDLERVRTEWSAAVAARREYDTTYRILAPTGQVNWVHTITTPLRNQDDVVTGHLVAVADVTALFAAQDEAMAAQARFEAAFDSSPLGIALTSLGGEILEANRRLAQLTGRSTGALRGEQAENLFEPSELPDQEPWLDALLDETIASHRMERQLRLAEGAPTWVEVSIAAIKKGGQLEGLLYEFADVTARRLAETRAEHLALHDPLTDLPNRLLLLDRLGQSLLEAARHGRGVGVLFVDLDRFKVVNDSLGHHAGDAVLIEVAVRLKRHARATDTVARIGGDEFVVVCPDVGSTRDVLEIADKMRAAVAKPISVGDQIAEVDASIGVAFGAGESDAESLLRDADQAMYHAKDRGRARYAVFDRDLRIRIQHRLDTELGLRAAVERGEIETWYQPIVDLQEPSVVANEALARWRRPEIGIVMPDKFIAIADETGLIKDVGAAVLTQACLAAAAMPDGPAVSVNVSSRQFARHDFGAVVDRALSLSQLPPGRLWLELTEGTLVKVIDSAARTFQELREQGVLLAIDDFGTGFSSFEHLRTFTVDILKIDMTFIHDVTRSDHDRAIVEGILRLADSLHLDVVAEGIETTAQRDLLRGLGCRFGQGYLFGRPSPISESLTDAAGR